MLVVYSTARVLCANPQRSSPPTLSPLCCRGWYLATFPPTPHPPWGLACIFRYPSPLPYFRLSNELSRIQGRLALSPHPPLGFGLHFSLPLPPVIFSVIKRIIPHPVSPRSFTSRAHIYPFVAYRFKVEKCRSNIATSHHHPVTNTTPITSGALNFVFALKMGAAG